MKQTIQIQEFAVPVVGESTIRMVNAGYRRFLERRGFTAEIRQQDALIARGKRGNRRGSR